MATLSKEEKLRLIREAHALLDRIELRAALLIEGLRAASAKKKASP